MMVARVTIQRREEPWRDPVVTLAAQLPGSMQPTVTSTPGPMSLRTSEPLPGRDMGAAAG